MSDPKPDWTLVVSGGGSGGHLFPAVAVVEELRARQAAPTRIIFLTAEREIEHSILAACNVEQVALPAVESHEFRRRPMRSLWRMGKAIVLARRLLSGLTNPVVLATGGFGSIPGGIAAWRNKVPLILLEQNAVAGRATSLLSRFATRICTSFEHTELDRGCQPKTTLTGNPVRSAIAKLTGQSDQGERRAILVLGGSQGARKMNQAMRNFALQQRAALTGWRIIHHTGETDAAALRETYLQCDIEATVAPFFDNMSELYQQAGIVISRAGGTSLAELACAGLPAILIPYPKSLRDHQEKNAQRFVDAGAAVMIKQSDAGFETSVAQELQRLLSDQVSRETMSAAMRSLAVPDAAARVVEILMQSIVRAGS